MSNLPFVRKLGKNCDASFPAVGLGLMSIGPGIYGAPNDDESRALLRQAIKIGCTFWDTADIYGMGHSERLIGEVIKDCREKVFLCTKFAMRLVDGKVEACGDPEYVREACDASLKRLGVKSIDLYYIHRRDRRVPIEVTMWALKKLVEEGKIRHIGLSEVTAETIRRAHAVHPITALEVEYSPWTLDIESNGVLETCRELGIIIVAYAPLGRGFLTGTIKSPDDLADDDWRKSNPRFQGENFQKNLDIVEKLKQVAAKKGVSVSKLCLAWIIAQGEDFFVIPGTRKIKYMEDNFNAKDVKLTAEEVAEIRKICQEAQVAGSRYLEESMHNLNG